ncbi:F-box only protein 7 [Trichomycterus rosablanca]|uniref:F-box only protein 7 n=1 Tax=Trichomycterus rosablanca TaxID=2290929 RepID=UPI002F355030
MKLRVRVNKQTSHVELEGAEPTLTQLSTRVKEDVLPSAGISADTEFSLSLNGKDPLVDTGQTLSLCGVVSGDIISVILPQSSLLLLTSLQTNGNSHHQNTQKISTETAMWSEEAGTSSSHSEQQIACDPEAEEKMERSEDEEAVGVFIPEPMLCCEAEEGTVPHSLETLYQNAQSQSNFDCLLLAAHVLLLETGYVPQGCDVRAGEMPTSWRAQGGIYRLEYAHPLCEDSLAQMVAVPMGQTLVINATLKISSAVQSAQKLVLKPDVYVTKEWPGGKAGETYKDLQKLSRVFKDQLAYPLIAAAREALGLPALFGLAALPPELLLRILRLLDVHSLLALSTVCRHLNTAAHDPSLWRHLLHRDFRVCIRADSEQRVTDWKEMYRKRYKQKKDLSRFRVRSYPYPIPPIYPLTPVPIPPVPLFPPGIIGGVHDQRLAIPQSILPRPRYDPISALPGHEPGTGFPIGRRSLRPGGSRASDIRRGFI